jgi:hypothetical protein
MVADVERGVSGMTRATPEEYAIMQERVRLNMGGPTVDALTGEDLADPGPESELQKKIVADAKANGWPCLSFRQSRKAEGFLVPGWPDVTLCLPLGRVVFMELKAQKKDLGKNQKLIFSMMKMLGQEVYKVKSWKRYVQIREGKP